jgi:S-adenosylmethionine:tRNA ribosyltransferase-isomerase
MNGREFVSIPSSSMDVREFDFHLPSALIAQEPAAERGAGRLLVLRRDTGRVDHRAIADLPEFLRAGDVLVVNDTRVFPARLMGRRVPSGGTVECLLLGRLAGDPDEGSTSSSSEQWDALMHPGQRLGPGAQVVFEGLPTIHGEILARRFHGRRVIRLWTADGSPIDDAVDTVGHVPLPPYIKRPDRTGDRDRYQTIFARHRGSIAAPTAGLHISSALMAALDRRGVVIVEVTLHVGYGTFQPVRVERIEEHRLEAERYDISPIAAAQINLALDERRRVVAVGTTTTRALEAVARANGGRLAAGAGETDLFIYPGFDFRVVGGLMTNFHLPRSSLLMLVAAFAGRERVLTAYGEAVAERYRFYSYGDAMLIL